MRRLLRRRPSPALVISLVALFVALGGTAYAVAANSIRSGHIVNDAVTTADIKGGGGGAGTIKNRDVHPLLAVAKGFTSVAARNSNGPAAILNFGGQQTRTDPPGVSAARTGVGRYRVVFASNAGTGNFVNVDNVNDLAFQATARGTNATASVLPVSASGSQVVVDVVTRNASSGNPSDRTFSVQFYARTTN